MTLSRWKRPIASIALVTVPVGIWLGVKYFESGFINEIILFSFSPILISIVIEFWELWILRGSKDKAKKTDPEE